jgi:hypothetical protein
MRERRECVSCCGAFADGAGPEEDVVGWGGEEEILGCFVADALICSYKV